MVFAKFFNLIYWCKRYNGINFNLLKSMQIAQKLNEFRSRERLEVSLLCFILPTGFENS